MVRLVDATAIVLTTTAAYHVVVAQGVSAPATFEVVSIRRVAESTELSSPPRILERVLRITETGRLVGRADLRNIVRLAYRTEPHERVITAEPDASSSLEEHFEITAVPPQSASPPNREDVRAMTRHMLAERFGLKVRIGSETVTATVLRTIKPGVLGRGARQAPEGCSPLPADARPSNAKFDKAYLRSCFLTFFDHRLRGTVTLQDLARTLTAFARRPILDRTDLTGLFTFDVSMASASLIPQALGPLGAAVEQSDAPAFVDALRDQLGLRARREPQPVRLFVVEHVGPLVEN